PTLCGCLSKGGQNRKCDFQCPRTMIRIVELHMPRHPLDGRTDVKVVGQNPKQRERVRKGKFLHTGITPWKEKFVIQISRGVLQKGLNLLHFDVRSRNQLELAVRHYKPRLEGKLWARVKQRPKLVYITKYVFREVIQKYDISLRRKRKKP